MSIPHLHGSLQVTQTRLSYLKGEGSLLPQDSLDDIRPLDKPYLEVIKEELEAELAYRRSNMH